MHLKQGSWLPHFITEVYNAYTCKQCTSRACREKKMVPLTPQAQEDLEWWVSESCCHLNGCPIQLPPIDLTIWNNASKKGWGTAYQGISTRGHWSVEEAKLHINVLELRAATLALKALLQPQKSQHPPLKHIHLRIDTTTAVVYINKRGGPRTPLL